MQQEKLIVEEKYGNLQEEAAGKTKKLQKINQMYKSAKAEVLFFTYLIRFISQMFLICENNWKWSVVKKSEEKIGNTSKLHHFVVLIHITIHVTVRN